ncbi:MAG: hypothetical protein HY918_01775 [Candidatus Doudnabacteria bacterium]|nr:hypothetical protein [Candidatus Doudnabacteria bacterium]
MNKNLLIAVALFILGLTLISYQTQTTLTYIDVNTIQFPIGHGDVLGATTFTDSFTGNNGTSLSSHDSNWVSPDPAYLVSGLELNNNQVRTTADWAITGAMYNSSNSDTSQIVIKNTVLKSRYVCARMGLGSGKKTGYCANFASISGSNWTSVSISKNKNWLTSFSFSTPQTSDHTLKIVVSGTSSAAISVYSDETLVGSFTDSSSPLGAGGHPGFIVEGGGVQADTLFDDWSDGAGGTTASDATAPIISGIASSAITSSSATITWITDESSDTQVDFDTTLNYGQSTTLNSSQTTTHTVTLSSLLAGTYYHFRVKSRDLSGNLAISSDNTFTTASASGSGDTTAPTAPANLSSSAVTGTSATLSWSVATDNVGVSGYKVYRNNLIIGTTASNSFSDLGLSLGISYVYKVAAFDAAGNTSAFSNSLTVTTSGTSVQNPSDSIAPTVPKHLYGFRTSVSDATIIWDSSTDNVAVTSYNIYRFGIKIGSSLTTKYVDSGLVMGAGYAYSVTAVDAAGNESAQAAAVNVVMPFMSSAPGDGTCSPAGSISAAAQQNLDAIKQNLPGILADADNYDNLIAPYRNSGNGYIKDSANMVDLSVYLLRTLPVAINCSPEDFAYNFTLAKIQAIQAALPYFYGKAQAGQDAYAGMKKGVVAIKSDIDGQIDYYYFALPTNYNPATKYRLQVILHFAGSCAWEAAGIGSFKPVSADLAVGVPSSASALASTITDTVYIVPCGRGATTSYTLMAQKTILDEIADAMSRFSIDQNKITANGASMGGTGSVNMSTHMPDLFAGIGALTANADFKLPTGDYRYDGWTLGQNVGSVNYIMWNTPGDTSNYDDVNNFAANLQTLANAHPGYYKYQKYTDPAGSHGIIDPNLIAQGEASLNQSVKNPYPARVSFMTGTEQYDGAYWVHGITRSDVKLPGSIEAEVSGSTVNVTTTNLKTFNFDLSSANPLFSGKSSVSVNINGKVVTASTGGTAYFTVASGSWAYASGPDSGLYKKKGVAGPIADVFMDKPVLMVYGTKQGNNATKGRVLVDQLAQVYFGTSISGDSFMHYGKFEMKADTEVTQSDIQTKNLVLFGDSSQNSIVSNIAGSLPFQFSSSGVQINGQNYTGAKLGWSIVYPNPLNNSRYVLLVSENYNMGLTGFINAYVLQNDYVVAQGLDSGPNSRKVLAQGLFDSQWKTGGGSTAPVSNAPVINSFTSSASNVSSGQAVTLNWSLSGGGATAVSIDQGVGSVLSLTSKIVSPSANVTYTLTATNSFGSVSKQVTVTVGQQQTSVGAHPRVLVTPSFISAKKANLSSVADWPALKAKADKFVAMAVLPYDTTSTAGITSGYRGENYYDVLTTLALAYQLSGNTAYADKGVEIMQVMDNAGLCIILSESKDATLFKSLNCTSGKGDSSNGYPIRNYGAGMALGYDWLYDRLSAAQKTAFYTQINEWLDWYAVNGFEVEATPTAGNFFGGYLEALALGGFATEGENPKAAGYIAKARSLITSTVYTQFSPNGWFYGGNEPEGFAYGSDHFIRLLNSIMVFKTAQNEDLFGGKNIPEQMAKFLLHATKPNLWQMIDTGEWGGTVGGNLSLGLPMYLSQLLAGTNLGAEMQYFLQITYQPAPAGLYSTLYDATPVEKILHRDTARTAVDYRLQEPLYYEAEGTKQFFTRSAWSNDAIWASFHGGAKVYSVGHENKDNGTFTIQRGNDYLVVDGSQYRQPDGWSGYAVTGYQSCNENTLFFNDFGDYIPATAANCGGQTGTSDDVPTTFENTDKYFYSKIDLTGAYDIAGYFKDPNKKTMLHYERSFLQLRPDMFLVFDLVSSKKPNYEKKFRLHFGNEPQINGDTITASSGGSKVFVKSLLPQTPTITKRGVTIDRSGIPTLTTWETDSYNPVAVTDDALLNVIYVAPSSVSTMVPTSKVAVQSGNMQGAQIQNQGNYVVLFNSNMTAAPVQSASYQVSSLTGQVTHYLLGMQANASFKIKKDGVDLGNITSSANGVLQFTSSGSGSFTVQSLTNAPVDVTAPVISSVSTSNITSSAVTVNWVTDELADGQLEYGLTTSYGTSTQVFPTMYISHYINLPGLAPSTTYHFRIKSKDAAGNLGVSADGTFTTAVYVAPLTPDVTAPLVAITTPTNNSTVSGTVAISVTASDPAINGATNSGLEVLTLIIDGAQVSSTTAGSLGYQLNTQTLTNGAHTISATAKDKAGNTANSAVVNITVNNGQLPVGGVTRIIHLTPEGKTVNKSVSGTLVFISALTKIVIAGTSINFSTNSNGDYTLTVPTGLPAGAGLRVTVNGYLPQIFTGGDLTSTATQTFTFPTLPAGDFNNDGAINTLDFSQMNSHWNQNYSSADINGDMLINTFDFSVLKNNWGKVGQ